MLGIKFTSHQHYLFDHLFSRNAKKAHIDQSTLHFFFDSVQTETTHKHSKGAAVKNFSPECVLWIQLVLMNVFYSKWQLEDIMFFIDTFGNSLVPAVNASGLQEWKNLIILQFQKKLSTYCKYSFFWNPNLIEHEPQ